MALRLQLVAVVATAILLLTILELVRRRRLLERYALLWLMSALILLGLAVWKGFLTDVAHAVGIFYPPSALFVIAFGFILILLLHFSVAVSRLADQNKVLAQRLALLEERQRETVSERDAGTGERPPTSDELLAHELAARSATAGEPVLSARFRQPGEGPDE
jgi:hypothetical protein